MAKPWMRLDTDFYLDRKVEDLEDMHKAAGVLKLVKLYLLATEEYGRLDLADGSIRKYVERRMKLAGKRLDSFVGDCVSCGLFNAELWESLHVVTSERLLKEGAKRKRLEEQRKAAALASAEARRKDGNVNESLDEPLNER